MVDNINSTSWHYQWGKKKNSKYFQNMDVLVNMGRHYWLGESILSTFFNSINSCWYCRYLVGSWPIFGEVACLAGLCIYLFIYFATSSLFLPFIILIVVSRHLESCISLAMLFSMGPLFLFTFVFIPSDLSDLDKMWVRAFMWGELPEVAFFVREHHQKKGIMGH